MKFLHIEEASYVKNFQVRLTFNDGTSGVADLQDSLEGPVFEPLKNRKLDRYVFCRQCALGKHLVAGLPGLRHL